MYPKKKYFKIHIFLSQNNLLKFQFNISLIEKVFTLTVGDSNLQYVRLCFVSLDLFIRIISFFSYYTGWDSCHFSSVLKCLHPFSLFFIFSFWHIIKDIFLFHLYGSIFLIFLYVLLCFRRWSTTMILAKRIRQCRWL